MAKNGIIKTIVDNIQNNMDKLYGNTYLGSNTNKKDLEDLKRNIDTSIDSILKYNKDNIGISNLSKLYSRTDTKQDKNGGSLESLLNGEDLNSSIIGTFSENTWIVEYDADINLILKYMPRLYSALSLKKDHVLMADSFSKDFIRTTNKSNVQHRSQYLNKIDNLKDIYNLNEFIESCYENTSKYGEQYIYIKPYTEAFEALNKPSNNVVQESVITHNLTEKNEEVMNVTIKFNNSKILQSAIREHSSILESITESTNEKKSNGKNRGFEGLDGNKVDGLIDINSTKKESNENIKVPGCVLKKLKRENIIPIYVESTCLGYYYIECDYDSFLSSYNNRVGGGMVGGAVGSGGGITNPNGINGNSNNKNRDDILNKITKEISKNIDAKFINNNQDLRKEIYMILKHSKMQETSSTNINVTFLPAEDVIHMYFNKNENNNRGVSDLDGALVPAKLYIAMLMNNMLGVLTRSQDKRIYYVKNHIDTNISKTLLNTINQLKKSNFNSREIMNIKNFLNIQGQFNDFLIPMGPSGDSPINFEMMQGQDIDMKEDFLSKLEEMAVNTTDIPYEYVSSSDSVDFAMRITMHNGKTLRMIVKRQGILCKYISRIMSKLYNYEYDDNDIIDVVLPAPSYLDSVNTTQIVDSISSLADNIVEMETAAEDDDVMKELLKGKIKWHYMSSYVDRSLIQTLREESEIEAKYKTSDEE